MQVEKKKKQKTLLLINERTKEGSHALTQINNSEVQALNTNNHQQFFVVELGFLKQKDNMTKSNTVDTKMLCLQLNVTLHADIYKEQFSLTS